MGELVLRVSDSEGRSTTPKTEHRRRGRGDGRSATAAAEQNQEGGGSAQQFSLRSVEGLRRAGAGLGAGLEREREGRERVARHEPRERLGAGARARLLQRRDGHH